MVGYMLIQAERIRQIEVEGHNDSADYRHTRGELAVSAALLAADQTYCSVVNEMDPDLGEPVGACPGIVEKHRGNRIRQLEIAGALIAAEIDRLLRLEVMGK